MRLTVGKKQGFIITGSSRELLFASQLPGSSYRTVENVVRIPVSLSSWKILRTIEFDSQCPDAAKHMKRLAAEWRDRRRQLRNATRRFKLSGVTDIPVPLKTLPMEHQVRAFGFCSSLPESALFMDMGTGKTLVAIAIAGQRYLERKSLKVLVICPKAVKPVWPKELSKHAGFPWSATLDKPPEGEGCQFWVTNYDRVKRELRRIKKWKPDMVILDESHKIKNRKAGRTKAVTSIKSEFKLLMSGSPLGKCISEAWSQINFLTPSVFGSFSQFKERYLKMGGYMNYKVIAYKNEEEFAEKLHSLAFRVTKDECMDLPPMTFQKLYVESDKKTKQIYKELDLEFYSEVDGSEVSVDREVTKQMKLRQVTGGLVKADDDRIAYISQQKVGALEELLDDRLGKKTVIFFSFTHEIELVSKMLKKNKIGYITLQGSTTDRDRNQFETRFQENENVEVALIQIATGAEGLTLTAADCAVFYSPSFSFLWYIQARDRIRRIGQTKPTTIIWLIMEGTVDEHVVSVLEYDGQLVDSYLEDKRTYSIGESKMSNVKKAVTKPAVKTAVKAEASEAFTAADLAAEFNIEAAELRKHLRASGAVKPEGGWKWSKSTDKSLVEIRKQVKASIAASASKPAKDKGTSAKPAPVVKKAKAEEAPAAKKVVRRAAKKE